MVAVFSIFATLDVITFKQLGVGLAAAVLIDATLVRGVALPAVVALLGERGWRMPGWKNAAVALAKDRTQHEGYHPPSRRGEPTGRLAPGVPDRSQRSSPC